MDETSWEQRVRERAYAIWEREGRPEGGTERHWARAEEELRAGEEERDRAEAPGAETAGTAGTETWTGPDGSVGGEPRAEDQGRAEAPVEAARTAKGTRPRRGAKAGGA
jgi:hypothetical protein